MKVLVGHGSRNRWKVTAIVRHNQLSFSTTVVDASISMPSAVHRRKQPGWAGFKKEGTGIPSEISERINFATGIIGVT